MKSVQDITTIHRMWLMCLRSRCVQIHFDIPLIALALKVWEQLVNRRCIFDATVSSYTVTPLTQSFPARGNKPGQRSPQNKASHGQPIPRRLLARYSAVFQSSVFLSHFQDFRRIPSTVSVVTQCGAPILKMTEVCRATSLFLAGKRSHGFSNPWNSPRRIEYTTRISENQQRVHRVVINDLPVNCFPKFFITNGWIITYNIMTNNLTIVIIHPLNNWIIMVINRWII